MTVATLVYVVLGVAVGLRWRKLRRDARRRRWSTPITPDARESPSRIRIVGDDHIPADPTEPVALPRLQSNHRYVFGEVEADASPPNGVGHGRDRALERAGRRRRHRSRRRS